MSKEACEYGKRDLRAYLIDAKQPDAHGACAWRERAWRENQTRCFSKRDKTSDLGVNGD